MRGDIYADDRVAYMNARREAKRSRGAASGGKTYIVKRNARAERERLAALDEFERTREETTARFSDFRAETREIFNRLRTGLNADPDIPF